MECLDLDDVEISDVENMNSQQEENLWPNLSDYFKFVKKAEKNLIYQCQLCLPKKSNIKAHVSSPNNLKQHIKRTHSASYVNFNLKVKIGSNPGKKHKLNTETINTSDKRPRQQSIDESFNMASTSSNISQTTFEQRIVNFFVENMIPINVVESNSFEQLINPLYPKANSMSRRTLGRRIVESHADLKQHLIKTTTDSASNFLKAFTQYGTEADLLESISTADENCYDSNDAVETFLAESEEEQDINYMELTDLLATYEDFDETILLSKHMRCAAHQFNLIACKDAENALKVNSFKNAFSSAIEKARALWNIQSRSTKAADRIQSELGRRVVFPNTTRWNSTYDALVILKEILDNKRNNLFRAMVSSSIPTFTDQDMAIVKEYIKVMSPVAKALDQIQGESQAYLGALLPTVAVTVLCLKEIKMSGIQYCAPLVTALLDGIEKRFGPLFKDEECQLAAAFHPKFRLFWLEKYQNSLVQLVQKKWKKKCYML